MDKIMRKSYIDMAKGIGILLVIFGHSATGANEFVSWQCTFFMPMFFICSGLCYTKPKTIIQNMKRILVPYYLWAGVGFLLQLCLIAANGAVEIGDLGENLVGYLLGMDMWNYPLWFLVAFFVCKILFDCLMTVQIERKLKPYIHIVVAIVAFTVAVYLGHLRKTYAFFFPFRADIGLAMIPFMMFGFYSKQLAERLNGVPVVNKLLLACSLLAINIVSFNCNTLVSVNSSDYGNPFMFLIGAVSGSCFVIILCQIASRISLIEHILAWFGKNSLTIMCTHAIVLLFVAKLLLTANRLLGFSTATVDLMKFICCSLAMIPLCLLLNAVKRVVRAH